MHDPKCVAHEIYIGKKKKKNGHYRDAFITIWHVDKCHDGTDDSCGWFIRDRHCNQEILEKIKKEFDFNFKHNYWFDKEGNQIFSTIGTLMNMYDVATWIHFKHNRKKQAAFMRKYCYDIIRFAENAFDCGGDNITGKYYKETNSDMLSPDRFSGLASMVYSDIIRKERKWYQHPKWHIHHWSIQFNALQRIKRRFWDKCCRCGKRGFKTTAFGDWSGKNLWHEECNNTIPTNKVTA